VLAADDPNARFRALVFSKTSGFRHDSIPAGIAAIQQLGQQKNFQVDATEDASLFTDAVLAHYDTVIWLSTTSDVLDDAQQAAFERYIRAGGGYTGIHAAADTEYTWPWYGQLVGAYFRNHPSGTPTATVVVEDANDPSTAGLPARWERTDEWYNYQSPVNPVVNGGGTDYSARNTTGVHVLLKMDESTYAEDDGSDGTDDDHPISWCHRYDGGRAWYTGMGHTQASYSEAGFLSHILAGIEMTAGVTKNASCGVPPDSVDVPVTVGGSVAGVLSLTLGPAPSLGSFEPAVARDYTASVASTVTSTMSAAKLTVRDPSANATGRLVNGSAALAQPLQLRTGSTAFAPLSTIGAPLTLRTWSGPVSGDTQAIDLKQSIGATEPLLVGNYSKTIVFTLASTTP
jgi:type 1 glutamine amidotransferase